MCAGGPAHPCAAPHPAQGEWDERDPAKRIPSPLVPGLLRFVKGAICAALWVRLSGSYGAGAPLRAGAAAATQQPRFVSYPQHSVQVGHEPVLAAAACTAASGQRQSPALTHRLPPAPPAADLLESAWFLREATLAQRLFFLWFVGLVARLKY